MTGPGGGRPPRVLLVDGDLYAYQAALSVERAVSWSGAGEGAADDALWTLHSDAAEAVDAFEALLERVSAPLEPDRIVIALSDGASWRRRILPTYKAARAKIRKPLALPTLRGHIRRAHDVESRPSLEADDVIGLMMTEPEAQAEERICLTRDKDLRGVPGLHASEQGAVERVGRAEADRWHLVQSLAGDPTDGYQGCPGLGRQSAEGFLDAPYELYPARRRSKAGAVETRWEKRPSRDLWRGIVSLFARAGLGEAEALVQARVARILRHGELDDAGQPILWRPAWLRRR